MKKTHMNAAQKHIPIQCLWKKMQIGAILKYFAESTLKAHNTLWGFVIELM